MCTKYVLIKEKSLQTHTQIYYTDGSSIYTHSSVLPSHLTLYPRVFRVSI